MIQESKNFKVFNAFNRLTGNDYTTPVGSRMKNVYEEHMDKDGHRVLEKTGETNIYDQIQLDLESSKIQTILKRFQMGDMSVIQNTEQNFIDTTQLPKSLMEMMNLNIKLETEFEKLPLEERAKYNHSVGEWMKHLDEEMQKKVTTNGNNGTENQNGSPIPDNVDNKTEGV